MSNKNIFSLIFILLLFTFSHCSPFNEMSSDSLEEFMEDSETCLNKGSENCLTTTNLQKKGTVASQCCIITDENGKNGFCINLSNNLQVQNYFLYFNAFSGPLKYTCSSDGNLEDFDFDRKRTKTYEEMNYEIAGGQNATTKEGCFKLAGKFTYANGCCFFDENCLCFSEGISKSKNEMEILLMQMEKDKDDLKGVTLECKDKDGETSGTYESLFGSGEIIKFSGIWGLLILAINIIL